MLPQRGHSRPNIRNPAGGWFWLVILGVLVAVLWFTLGNPSAGLVAYTDFMQLAKEGLFTKVTIFGKERAVGELNNEKFEEAKVKDKVRNKARSGRLATNIVGGDVGANRMAEDLQKTDVEVAQEQEPGGWIGPAAVFLLPVLIILAIFFFLLLPRFRDTGKLSMLGTTVEKLLSGAMRAEQEDQRANTEKQRAEAEAKGRRGGRARGCHTAPRRGSRATVSPRTHGAQSIRRRSGPSERRSGPSQVRPRHLSVHFVTVVSLSAICYPNRVPATGLPGQE
jgi:hypothetical protein